MILTGADKASSQDHALEETGFETRTDVMKRNAAHPVDWTLPVSLFMARYSWEVIWAGDLFRSAFAPLPSPHITGLRLRSQSTSFDWEGRGSRFVSGPRRYHLLTAPPLSPRTAKLMLMLSARMILSPYRCLLRMLPALAGTPARYETKPNADKKTKPDQQL